jgi:hypothetical protein
MPTIMTVENKGSFEYSQHCMFKSLRPFWTLGNWWGDGTVQREDCIQAAQPKETQSLGIKIYKLCDT